MDQSLIIPKKHYLHPNLEKRFINKKVGYGIFTKVPIKKGEILEQASGRLITRKEYKNLDAEAKNYAFEVDDEFFLAPHNFKKMPDGWYINHSCNPNSGGGDAFTSFALRDISKDEEITYDYAIVDTESSLIKPMECHCGAKQCRKKITANDWKIPELQKRYRGMFSPHVQRKIDALKNN